MHLWLPPQLWLSIEWGKLRAHIPLLIHPLLLFLKEHSKIHLCSLLSQICSPLCPISKLHSILHPTEQSLYIQNLWHKWISLHEQFPLWPYSLLHVCPQPLKLILEHIFLQKWKCEQECGSFLWPAFLLWHKLSQTPDSLHLTIRQVWHFSWQMWSNPQLCSFIWLKF